MFMSVLALSIIQLFPSCIHVCLLNVYCTIFMLPLEDPSHVNWSIKKLKLKLYKIELRWKKFFIHSYDYQNTNFKPIHNINFFSTVYITYNIFMFYIRNILMKASTKIIIQYTQNLSVEYTCTI